MLEVVKRTADQVFIPLTVGGGVRNVADVRRLLNAGADKVSFNSAAVAEPEVIRAAFEAVRAHSEAPVVVSLTFTEEGTTFYGDKPEDVVRTLEEWGVPSRLASGVAQSNCYRGFVTDLARAWLATLDERSRAEVAIYACGPTAMLAAALIIGTGAGLLPALKAARMPPTEALWSL